jgi:hypothetical protein
MAQSAEIRHDVGFLSTLPLGSIIAWHRDLLEQGLVALPPGWVECNGQKLDDPDSPFHGHVIPNLNLVDRDDILAGRNGGAFLRGAPRSGEIQEDQFQGHHLRVYGGGGEVGEKTLAHRSDQGHYFGVVDFARDKSHLIGYAVDVVSDGKNGVPRTGPETRPVNMSVIWIMKIRQFTVAVGGGLFQQRSFATVRFTREDQDGAERTVALGFVPRVLWITGLVQVGSGREFQASGPITGFADLEDRGKTHAISTIPVLEVSDFTQGLVRLEFSDRKRRSGGVVFRSGDRELEFMTNVPLAQENGFSIGLQILNPGDLTLPDQLELRLNLLCMR